MLILTKNLSLPTKYSVTLAFCFVFTTGCAEGILWRTGQYAPWVREDWAAEEKIADTLFSKKRRMSESVASVQNAPVETQQKVAQDIAEIVLRDPTLLLRLHGVHLLGQLRCPAATEALTAATQDHNYDIRIAAVKAWSNHPAQTAIPKLQQIIGDDNHIDVRLAAIRALGNFPGQQAVDAIALAIDDPDPAVQIRAAESLQQVTGQPFGHDIVAWQQFLKQSSPGEGIPPAGFPSIADRPEDPSNPSQGSFSR